MDERSKRINKAIEKSGYSYPELSKITGISKSSLQRYATGETKKISIDCIEKIAKATNTDSRYLMCWDDPAPAPNESESLIKAIDSDFSTDEIQRIKKYRTLDTYGKNVVDCVLDLELERCNASSSAKNIKLQTSELAIARSGNGGYMPAPTEEQCNSFEELTDDMLGE